jgi:hypothetical protein
LFFQEFLLDQDAPGNLPAFVSAGRPLFGALVCGRAQIMGGKIPAE